MQPGRIRTLIADDEAVARERLRAMLSQEEDIEIVGVSGTGREAVEAINKLEPELVFLDVQMPELNGFDVVGQITCPRMPVIIFVTGNQEGAVRAFDVQAMDYLVKPCRRERLKTALERARGQLEKRNTTEIHEKLDALLAENRPETRLGERIAVKSDGRIVLLRLAEVDWIEAADNYVNLHVGAESHLLRETMSSLESKLPSERFLRISRSAIVNVEHIKELHPMFHGEYVVVLRNGSRLTLSRGYREKLRQFALV